MLPLKIHQGVDVRFIRHRHLRDHEALKQNDELSCLVKCLSQNIRSKRVGIIKFQRDFNYLGNRLGLEFQSKHILQTVLTRSRETQYPAASRDNISVLLLLFIELHVKVSCERQRAVVNISMDKLIPILSQTPPPTTEWDFKL